MERVVQTARTLRVGLLMCSPLVAGIQRICADRAVDARIDVRREWLWRRVDLAMYGDTAAVADAQAAIGVFLAELAICAVE